MKEKNSEKGTEILKVEKKEYDKKQGIYKIIMAVIITGFITFLLTTTFVYLKIDNYVSDILNIENIDNIDDKQGDGLIALTRKLARIRFFMAQMYIGELNDEELVDGAIKGYIAAVGDEYTEYFTKAEMKEFTEDTEGKYVGIGIYMIQDNQTGKILVISPMQGSPAEEAGLLPGDIITKVDGVEYSGDQLSVAADKIKGEEGSKVKLEILRKDNTFEVEIERRTVHTEQVTGTIIDDNIAYIEVTAFNAECAKEFEKKYDELANKAELKGLIIDLRNNGGGLVEESLNIAELMVEKGKPLLRKTVKGEDEKVILSEKDPKISVPVTIIINEYTASASEILAGTLKENIGAKLVGKTSFGKGVIQTAITMPDGSGVKMTTNEYFTPTHQKINKIGLKPDIEVALPDDVVASLIIKNEDDTQLKAAIESLKK